MKPYTNLEQSKKLTEILPLKSADMHWQYIEEDNRQLQWFCFPKDFSINQHNTVLAWSLAALLSVLPFHLIVDNQRYAFSMHKGLNKDGETYMIRYNVFNTDVCLYATDYYNNTVDACYEMVLKLHERKLL